MVPSSERHQLSISSDGGLETLRQLFRIPRTDNHALSLAPALLEAVLISFDIETSGRTSKGQRHIAKVNQQEVSGVREVGCAFLDVRSLFPTPSYAENSDDNGKITMKAEHTTRCIRTKQFSTLHDSANFQDCDVTDFRECLFAETRRVQKEHLIDTLTTCFQFPCTHISIGDCDTGEAAEPRAIIIVGQSPQRDLEIARQLGLDFSRIVPNIVAVLDTHRLSKAILGAGSPLVVAGQRPALQTHALGDILTELGLAHDKQRDLHNAGNDATFTLYALVLLAARLSERVSADFAATLEQARHAELLRGFVKVKAGAPRWTPIRQALGAHSREKTLGRGLASLAWKVRSSG